MSFIHQFLDPGIPILIGVAIGNRVNRGRTDRRLASKGWLECAVKVTSGCEPGLTTRWRHVLARVSPGRLEIRGRWNRPGLTGHMIVASIDGPPRPPSLNDLPRLPNSYRIISIHTPGATVSIAVPNRHLDWAAGQLAT